MMAFRYSVVEITIPILKKNFKGKAQNEE